MQKRTVTELTFIASLASTMVFSPLMPAMAVAATADLPAIEMGEGGETEPKKQEGTAAEEQVPAADERKAEEPTLKTDESAPLPVADHVLEITAGGTTTGYADFGQFFATYQTLKGDITVKLLSDIVMPGADKYIPVLDGQNVILDMNGRSITVPTNFTGRPIHVEKGGSLTVTGNGTIDSSASEFGGYGAIDVYGSLTVKNGTFRGHVHADGTVLKIRQGGVAVIDGGVFTGSTGAIMSEGKLTINDGVFETDSCTKTIDANGKNHWAYCINSLGELYFHSGKVTGVQGALGISAGYAEVYDGDFKTVVCEHDAKGGPAHYALYIAGESGEVEAHIMGGVYQSASKVAVLCGNDNTGGDGGINAKATATITGGTFIGGNASGKQAPALQAGANTGDPTILGGSFSSDVSSYVPAGNKMMVGSDGKYTVVIDEEKAVAVVDGVGYDSLAKAAAAAKDGQIVKLMKDVDVSDAASGSIVFAVGTFDLNGHTLRAGNNGALAIAGKVTLVDSSDTAKSGTGNGKILATKTYGEGFGGGIIIVRAGGSLTMESGYIDCASEFKDDNVKKGQFGITLWNDAADASVTINGGKIEAGWYAVSGNGNNKTHKGTITVNGGELISTADYAIYSPQAGGVAVSGGVVYGAAGGIHLQRGELTVTGGTITSLGKGDTGDWGDGTGGSGNAAINIQAKYGDTTATITGGKITAEGDAIAIDKGSVNKAEVKVSGGTFNQKLPDEFLADGFGMSEQDENGNYGVHQHAWATEFESDETGHWHACSVCGEKDAVVAHEASDQLVNAEAATCGKDGYTGDTVCKDCGFAMKKGEKIPATGKHEFGKAWTFEGGTHWHECSVCGAKADEAEHVASAWTFNATEHWHVCEVCNAAYDEADHEFGDRRVTKGATETEAGERERVCKICGAVKTEIIPALGEQQKPDDQKPSDPESGDDKPGEQKPDGNQPGDQNPDNQQQPSEQNPDGQKPGNQNQDESEPNGKKPADKPANDSVLPQSGDASMLTVAATGLAGVLATVTGAIASKRRKTE